MFLPNLISPTDLEPYVELQYQRSNQATFCSFRNMWQRLHQITSVGRYVGVEVDPSWVSFKKFLSDMGDKPQGMTLDRIDNGKGYCPSNCKWATTYEQAANRKNVLRIFDGYETLPLKAMCRKYKKSYATIHHRIVYSGWSVDEALCTPIGKRGTNSYNIKRVSWGRFKSV